MTTTDSNGIIRYQTTDPVSPLHTLLNLGMQSVSDAVTTINNKTTINVVSNTAARTALVTALTAAGKGPTPARPLFVSREDTPPSYIESTTDGVTWRAVGAPEVLTASTTASGVYTDSVALLTIDIPAAPYARLLDVGGQIYGGAISGSWLGALSVAAGGVSGAQRLGIFPQSGEGSVSLSMTYYLPASVASNARIWYRRSSPSGSITNVATGGSSAFVAGAFTNLTVKMHGAG